MTIHLSNAVLSIQAFARRLLYITASGCAPIGATAHGVTGCGFNVDALGTTPTADMSSDGLLVTRHIQKLTGAALITGTRADQSPANLATVVTAVDAHMAAYRVAFDVDGNSDVDVSDAIIITRYLAGFRGTKVTAGLTLSGMRRAFGVCRH